MIEEATVRDQVHVCPDAEALANHACHWLVGLIQSHIEQSDAPFSLALSGGSTPKRLYQLLSECPAGTIPWDRVLLLWGDERNVPPDHAESNFRMVKEALLDHIVIPAENILAVPEPGGPADWAAAKYEQLLQQRMGMDPELDCVLLGIGDDVHTASLFPGTTALNEQRRLIIENRVEKLNCWRITMTAPLINSARNVAFLIAGSSKQQALNSLWHAPPNPQEFPSHLIRPGSGQLWYLLDQTALNHTPTPVAAHVELISS